MKVSELIKILKDCQNPDGSDVYVYTGTEMLEIQSIGQYGLVTDVIISIQPEHCPKHKRK